MALNTSFLCSPQAIPYPVVFGAQILGLTASLVTNFSAEISEVVNVNKPTTSVRNAEFCNVTVTYTHPGQNDTIIVESWLPSNNWNGRMQSVGGGGWQAGRFDISYLPMSAAVGEGYATVTTDAGLGDAVDSSAWAQISEGNVNRYLLHDLTTISLNDQAIIGKSVINSYYGRGPEYSYFSGCSQGGRQGLLLAQRFPDAYDGIASSAPAVYYNQLLTNLFWPQLVLNLVETIPHNCEMDAITAAAILACDGNDGVVDGLIADPYSCKFDPFSLVGTSTTCGNSTRAISESAAVVVNATWSGPVDSSGRFLWYGMTVGSDLTANLATTSCSDNGTCVGVPLYLIPSWMRLFLDKHPDYNLANMTHAEYDRLFQVAREEYANLATASTNLNPFFARGGKIVGYHGLADAVITPGGTRAYLDAVRAAIPNMHDSYRMFEVPGMGHCYFSQGGWASTTFDALRSWVENGTAPDTLPVTFERNGTVNHRTVCPYPQKQVYDGFGDTTLATSYSCSA